jgi:3-hydroxybutyryl-CoA dehydrogenase
LFATAGVPVLLYDSRSEATQALQANRAVLERSAAKGKLSNEALASALACMRPAISLEALADCDLLIEAIVENLEAKQGLFRALEQVVRADAVLATNTSSLSVSLIASACKHPERVAGFHFFNPVPLMKIVEVVRGELTDPQVILPGGVGRARWAFCRDNA